MKRAYYSANWALWKDIYENLTPRIFKKNFESKQFMLGTQNQLLEGNKTCDLVELYSIFILWRKLPIENLKGEAAKDFWLPPKSQLSGFVLHKTLKSKATKHKCIYKDYVWWFLWHRGTIGPHLLQNEEGDNLPSIFLYIEQY